MRTCGSTSKAFASLRTVLIWGSTRFLSMRLTAAGVTPAFLASSIWLSAARSLNRSRFSPMYTVLGMVGVLSLHVWLYALIIYKKAKIVYIKYISYGSIDS